MAPTRHRVRHPFDGNPETREETDENGNVTFVVTGRVLSPVRAKMADNLGAATACGVAAVCVLYVIYHNPNVIVLLLAGSTWFLRPMFERLWREALRRKLHMVVTEKEFRFRLWMRWIVLDRTLPHKLSLKVHDLARQERDQHELQILKAQQQKKIVQPRRYYQESYHFFYELLGMRNDIAEIFGQPDAQAVLTRLRAIDEVMNARARRSDGTALKPGDQWVKQPGEIPETGD
jgi:hypothetical protein